MDFKRLFSVLSMVFILAAFAGAGIDLDDPLQTGQQSYVPRHLLTAVLILKGTSTLLVAKSCKTARYL